LFRTLYNWPGGRAAAASCDLGEHSERVVSASVQQCCGWWMCAGVEGRVGPRGTPGAAGNTGFTGAIGPVGAQGPPGATGGVDAQGMRGDVGNAGPIGATGQPGARGLPGTKGPSVATHFSLSLSACRLLCRLEENSIGDNSRALNGRVFS